MSLIVNSQGLDHLQDISFVLRDQVPSSIQENRVSSYRRGVGTGFGDLIIKGRCSEGGGEEIQLLVNRHSFEMASIGFERRKLFFWL